MAMTPEARRAARCQKIEKGLCAMEGCQLAVVSGKRKCQKHLDRDASNATKRNQAAVASGICPRCKKRAPAADRTYCRECLEECNELTKANYRKDPSRQKAAAARWYRDAVAEKRCPQCNERDAEPGYTNCAECRAYHSKGAARRQTERRQLVFARYGTTCKCCGQDKPLDKLQIDHVDGGGRKHFKEIGFGRLYAWLIKNDFPAGFITLCADCNFAWGHNRCCSDAIDRLVPIPVDGETVLRDPQTGKIARNIPG